MKTKEIVQKTFDAIVDTLVRDERIELRNFGVFEVKKRAARKARNPRTGERVDVAEKYVVTFKPGKEMEERVRQLEQRKQAEQIAHAARPGQEPRRPAVSADRPAALHGSSARIEDERTPSHSPKPTGSSDEDQPARSYEPSYAQGSSG
ncbi:MAG TPA: HU family DNA-binding protein [Planctomycetaceae bacterium]|nr:HU family DNA-binding protein [Planctomycetaceae bacterium]